MQQAPSSTEKPTNTASPTKTNAQDEHSSSPRGSSDPTGERDRATIDMPERAAKSTKVDLAEAPVMTHNSLEIKEKATDDSRHNPDSGTIMNWDEALTTDEPEIAQDNQTRTLYGDLMIQQHEVTIGEGSSVPIDTVLGTPIDAHSPRAFVGTPPGAIGSILDQGIWQYRSSASHRLSWPKSTCFLRGKTATHHLLYFSGQ